MNGPGPIHRQLDLLLSAYGYNLYDKKNRERADDLVVRNQAEASLSEASEALRQLRVSYAQRFIPPATRDNPFPPADRMAALREIEHLQTRLGDLATRIRAMPVPPSDKVWQHFRKERQTLEDLLLHDYNLIQPCTELRDIARGLQPDDWTAERTRDLDQRANAIERALRERVDFLASAG